MTPQEIRVECLKLACSVSHDANAAAEHAKAFEAFVKGSDSQPQSSERPQDRLAA